MARGLVADGDRLFRARELEAALARYRAAFELVPAPTVGVEVVKAQIALQQLLEAKAMAIRVMSIPVQRNEPAVFEQARAAAERFASELDAKIPELWIRLPEDAEVSVKVGGVTIPAPVLELPLRLNPGRHLVSASASGYQTFQTTVELAESRHEEVDVQLLPLAPSGPAAIAPASSIGENAAAAASAGAETRGLVALGFAGAGIAVGSAAGILAFDTAAAVKREYCEGNTCDPAGRRDGQRSETYGTIATISFAIGALAAVYGGWELLFNAEDATSAAPPRAGGGTVSVGASAGRDGAVLTLMGEF